VVDCVDEEGEAEDIGEEDEFLGGKYQQITSPKYVEESDQHTCRTSLLICPTLTRKFNAAIHSVVLNLVSRAKSWRWDTSRSITYVRRSSFPWEFIMMVFSVILSILRSFIGGTLTCLGSILDVVLWFQGLRGQQNICRDPGRRGGGQIQVGFMWGTQSVYIPWRESMSVSGVSG
jgi:hypothetical protein